MSEPQLPKEPETEKGRLMRQQYLALAKASLKDAKDYESLYTRYSDRPSSGKINFISFFYILYFCVQLVGVFKFMITCNFL